MTQPPNTVPLIDVSAAQGSAIDWAAVYASGVRACYVEHGVGNDTPNGCAAAQVADARAAGLLVGRYDFLFPIGLPGAGRDPGGQAGRHVALAQGESWDLPPVIDLEWPPASEFGKWGCSPEQIVQWVLAYLAARPDVTRLYSMPGFLETLGWPHEFGALDLWIAHWDVPVPDVQSPWSDWSAWQHSSTGSLPGITGPVDLSWLRVPPSAVPTIPEFTSPSQ